MASMHRLWDTRHLNDWLKDSYYTVVNTQSYTNTVFTNQKVVHFDDLIYIWHNKPKNII